MEYEYYLKVPKDRIAVLIGKKGEIKKRIQKETGTKLFISSKDGEVVIKGEDALNLYSAREIIKAIARGFNPDISLSLLKQDNVLDIIPLKGSIKTKNDLKRIKARLIGKEGKARKTIEALTETYISIYGKTISIIGFAENVNIARKAIESLMRGAKHSKVYRFLEKEKKRLKKIELGIE